MDDPLCPNYGSDDDDDDASEYYQHQEEYFQHQRFSDITDKKLLAKWYNRGNFFRWTKEDGLIKLPGRENQHWRQILLLAQENIDQVTVPFAYSDFLDFNPYYLQSPSDQFGTECGLQSVARDGCCGDFDDWLADGGPPETLSLPPLTEPKEGPSEGAPAESSASPLLHCAQSPAPSVSGEQSPAKSAALVDICAIHASQSPTKCVSFDQFTRYHGANLRAGFFIDRILRWTGGEHCHPTIAALSAAVHAAILHNERTGLSRVGPYSWLATGETTVRNVHDKPEVCPVFQFQYSPTRIASCNAWALIPDNATNFTASVLSDLPSERAWLIVSIGRDYTTPEGRQEYEGIKFSLDTNEVTVVDRFGPDEDAVERCAMYRQRLSKIADHFETNDLALPIDSSFIPFRIADVYKFANIHPLQMMRAIREWLLEYGRDSIASRGIFDFVRDPQDHDEDRVKFIPRSKTAPSLYPRAYWLLKLHENGKTIMILPALWPYPTREDRLDGHFCHFCGHYRHGVKPVLKQELGKPMHITYLGITARIPDDGCD